MVDAMEIQQSTRRTAMVCILEPEDDPVVQVVMERVAALAGMHPNFAPYVPHFHILVQKSEAMFPLRVPPESHQEQVECLSVVRYTPGQMFKEHHDGAFRPKTGTSSSYSNIFQKISSWKR
jgi:hypothetical protein